MIEIKSISGQVRFSTPINKGAKGKFTLMKEDYIVLPFSTLSPIPFKLGDYVDLSGILDESLGGKLAKIYEIVDLQKPTYNQSTGGYDYQLRLDAYYWKWKNKIFKYTPEHAGSEASWSLTATLDVQLDVFLRNLKALGYTYRGIDFTFSIDDTVENKAVAMTYNNMNLLDALFSMAGEDKWNCDCWITDNVIHFGRNEFGDAVKIERGVEASSITRSESQGTYATRIYAFGSTKNIPTNYRPTDEQAVINGVVQKRLMLPADTPYIDAYEGMSQEEAIEDVVVFDNVLPRRVGRLSDVKTVDRKVENPGEGEAETFKAYQYKDTELVFKEEYILEGQQLEITFQSGKLNGMRFGVHFEPEGTSEGSQIWEIVRNENYGRPLPDDTLYPEDGNEYFLSGFNIQMVSNLYIPEAEQELKEKAQKYADKVKKDDGTYPTTLKSSWVKEDLISRTFEFGQRINIVDDTYFENGRISRVLGWELSLDMPWDCPVYTIGESIPYSRIGDIESKIDELTYKGQTYTGIGGNGIYVIRTNDSTAPSDSNVFSALRSLRQFTRKDVDDTVRGLLSMLKGIQSDDYSTGLLGAGFALKKGADGKSYAEVDRLLVRWQAVFNELNIKQTSYVGGEAVFSPASMQCVRVEETEIPTDFVQLADSNGTLLNDVNGVALMASTSTAKVYRCYFKQDNGNKAARNLFAVGDLAMCRQVGLANRYGLENLVTDGRLNIKGSTEYLIGSIHLSKELVAGNTYTFFARARITPPQHLGVWESTNMQIQFSFEAQISNRFIGTFKYNPRDTSQHNILKLYNVPSTGTKDYPADLDWVCVFEGDVTDKLGADYIPPADASLTEANRYYWRKVIGLGEDYIDLSVEDCMPGSDEPQEGDDIVTVGNVTDPQRQNAIIVSSYGEDAPSLKLYEHINDYDLSGKDVIVISPKGNKFKGEFILSTGTTVEEELGNISDTQQTLSDYVNAVKDDLQSQIDGEIASYFEKNDPTTSNFPANEWTTEAEKQAHANDTYTNILTGKSWKWVKNGSEWEWSVITDTATEKALANAAKAQETADGKRRVFAKQPTTAQAYDEGDLWVNATYGDTYSNDLLRANTSKATGEAFSINHWELASKYTDDTTANEAKEDAAAAQEAADNALQEAQDAKDRLNSWAEDGVISPTEKLALKDEIVRIDADKVEITNGYSKYSIGTPTAFNNAHSAYRAALVSLTATTPENITIPSDFATKQQTYYNERTEALNTIAIAAKNYVDMVVSGEIDGIRSEFESQFKILADEISQRVTKTDYDANNTEIREQIGELSTRADEISATVTENTNSIDGLTTQVGELSIKSDKISLSVSELQKGYVNYLLNSGDFKGTDKWSQLGNNGSLRVENGLLKYTVVDWNYAWGHLTEQISPNIDWEDGKTYTFSVKLSTNYTRDVKIGFRDSNGAFYYVQTFSVGISSKVCTYSFTYNASNHTNGKDITAFIIQTQTTENPTDITVIPPSVNIYYTMLVKGNSVPTEWVACPDDLGNELVRTGIDIENRKITLQADTTVIKNNDGEEIVMITEDGKLSAEAIDTDTLVAKVVKTTEDGKRVEIFDNKLTMYDEIGALKLVVSGEKLSPQPTSTSVTIPESSKTSGGSGSDTQYNSPEITLASINVQADNNIVTIPRITINIHLGKETNNYGSAMVNMYLLLDGLLLARAFSTDGAAMSCNASATYIGEQISLSKGTHTLKYKFSGFAQGDPYNINVSATPSTDSVYVDYTQDLIEIAADGFRSSSGANNYLKHTSSGTEIRCGNYGVKVTSSGIQRMRNGTTWENWQ